MSLTVDGVDEAALLVHVGELLQRGLAVEAVALPRSPTVDTVLCQLRRNEGIDLTSSNSLLAEGDRSDRVAALFCMHVESYGVGSKYTDFMLGFLESEACLRCSRYTSAHAIRLFQRFLLDCTPQDIDSLGFGAGVLQEVNPALILLRECLTLARNYLERESAPPTPITMQVLHVLHYDVHEVTPLDYFEAVSTRCVRLREACEQAMVLLLTCEDLLTCPSRLLFVCAAVFVLQHVSGETAAQLRASCSPCELEVLEVALGFLSAFK